MKVNEPFVKYGKTKRYNGIHVVITEKIDGTNGQIHIDENDVITVGSRNRIIAPEKDNFGFAAWVRENEDEVLKLGKGRHYGEWWGEGIQKNRYGVEGKQFSIFNTFRPVESLPDIINQVPILYEGKLGEDTVEETFECLKEYGSELGGNNPEGIIVFFPQFGTKMKMTYDYKDGKWGNK
jgi:hypothetical protein